jgi:hypothetical protein
LSELPLAAVVLGVVLADVAVVVAELPCTTEFALLFPGLLTNHQMPPITITVTTTHTII